MTELLPPTSEQQEALDLFANGENLAIEAGAGTGKTSTLLLLAHSTRRRGQYLAFNRAIVRDAGGHFPATVNASTAHSLAYRAVGHRYGHRLRASQRMRSLDIANRLDIDAVKVTAFDGEEKMLSQTFLAGLAMRSVIRFCQSADAEPTWRHVPWVPGLDPVGPDARKAMVNGDVARHLEPAVVRAWQDLTSDEGGLPYKHDVYLKLWQLSEPRIGADYVLFDECQDANPVMAAVVFAQRHAQLVFVGDSQQQIYSFTGAVNSLARIRETGCATAFLTQSFRFGPAVADVANVILERIEGAELRLRGFDVDSVVGPVPEPDCVLTRTNAAAVRRVLEAMRADKRVFLVGGTGEVTRFARAARSLMRGERTDHPELACFDSWDEVTEYVSHDEQGGDLRLMVGLVVEFGVDLILEKLAQVDDDESRADLVVSTAHKAKGREWDSVQLGPDFPEQPGSDEEKRLLYVAITRARRELDVSAVSYLDDAWEPREQSAPVATTAADARPRDYRPPEVVKERPSEHVGRVGETLDFDATVVSVRGMTTRFGWTNLTAFTDADGNCFKAFLDDELDEGTSYHVSGRVKTHGDFRGVKETTLNYVRADEIDALVGEIANGKET